jgi:hypothetical protein
VPLGVHQVDDPEDRGEPAGIARIDNGLRPSARRATDNVAAMDGTYGVREFVDDARRIMEVPGGVADREAAVRQLEPLLRRALDGPGWTDAEFATTVEGGRRGFDYYRNPDGSLFGVRRVVPPGQPDAGPRPRDLGPDRGPLRRAADRTLGRSGHLAAPSADGKLEVG